MDFQKTEPGSDVSEPFVDCEAAAVACRSRQGNWSIDGRNLAKNEIWLEEQDFEPELAQSASDVVPAAAAAARDHSGRAGSIRP